MALRNLLTAGINNRLNGREWRVLSAVVWLTASYSKLYDETYVARIAELAQVDASDPQFKNTKKILRNLARRGLIIYQPSKHQGQRTLIGIAQASDSNRGVER